MAATALALTVGLTSQLQWAATARAALSSALSLATAGQYLLSARALHVLADALVAAHLSGESLTSAQIGSETLTGASFNSQSLEP